MQKFEQAGYKSRLFIIGTNDETFIFVKAYACYYLSFWFIEGSQDMLSTLLEL